MGNELDLVQPMIIFQFHSLVHGNIFFQLNIGLDLLLNFICTRLSRKQIVDGLERQSCRLGVEKVDNGKERGIDYCEDLRTVSLESKQFRLTM